MASHKSQGISELFCNQSESLLFSTSSATSHQSKSIAMVSKLSCEIEVRMVGAMETDVDSSSVASLPSSIFSMGDISDDEEGTSMDAQMEESKSITGVKSDNFMKNNVGQATFKSGSEVDNQNENDRIRAPRCRRKVDHSSQAILPLKSSSKTAGSSHVRYFQGDTVSGAFAELRRRVPTYPLDRKLSKSDILRLTIRYIRLLTSVRDWQENSIRDFNNSDKFGSNPQSTTGCGIVVVDQENDNLKMLCYKSQK